MIREYDKYRHDQANAYLQHVRGIALEVRALEEAVAEYRERIYAVQGTAYDDAHHSAPYRDAVPDTVARLYEMMDEAMAKLGEYAEEQQRASRAIAKLSRPEYRVALSLHYLRCKSWAEVCSEMSYTCDGVMTLRRKAVIELYEVMPIEWRDPRHQAL